MPTLDFEVGPFYCVAGKCIRKAVDGHWLCARCAGKNGGDALKIKKGWVPFFTEDDKEMLAEADAEAALYRSVAP